MIRDSNETPTRRQRRRIARTEELVEHALRIVKGEGMDALTMPRLAQEADAAVGGLYRYFSSKDALVAALQARAVDAFAAFLVPRVRGSPLERIGAIVEAWPAFAEVQPELHGLVDRALSEAQPMLSDDQAARVQARVEEALQPLVVALREAEQAGVIGPGDAEVRAYALWAVVHGTGHFRKRDRILPPRLHASALRRELVRALLVGWGADPSAVAWRA